MSEVEAILADRQIQYGTPKENWTRIGRIWGAILNIPDIDAVTVGLMMESGLKTIRVANDPTHEDSWIDKEGYFTHTRDIALA
jgi:hypothetical protein